MSKVPVSVIILSFNRPNWIREALRSARDSSDIIIVDDGSDYDLSLLRSERVPFRLVQRPHMTPEERVIAPGPGKWINEALHFIRNPYVTYLCDDDWFYPGWLSQAYKFLEDDDSHLVGGEWLLYFADGITMWGGRFTAGNFVHRTECLAEVQWLEEKQASLDAEFLNSFNHAHEKPLRDYPFCGIAGFRRMHSLNLLSEEIHGEYAKSMECGMREGELLLCPPEKPHLS